jgi:hypothetical protein
MWAVLGGPLSNREKFNHVSKEWLGWGLRYPSGPTIRTGLATILVASNSTVTAEHAHELFWEFVELFRQIRAVTDGEATLKTFPSQASAFTLMHPDRLGEVVDCRVKPSLIRLTASKQHIPIRGNNKKLTSKQSPTSAASSAATPHREQFIEGLLELAMGRREPSTSPPPDRRREFQSEDVADRARPQQIELPPPLADEGVNREVAVPHRRRG